MADRHQYPVSSFPAGISAIAVRLEAGAARAEMPPRRTAARASCNLLYSMALHVAALRRRGGWRFGTPVTAHWRRRRQFRDATARERSVVAGGRGLAEGRCAPSEKRRFSNRLGKRLWRVACPSPAGCGRWCRADGRRRNWPRRTGPGGGESRSVQPWWSPSCPRRRWPGA